MVNKCLNNNHSVFSVAHCILCAGDAQQGLDLCCGCEDDLVKLGRCCWCCALPLAGSGPVSQRCGHCLKRPPHYDRVLTAYRYADPLSGLIQGFKFSQQLQNGRLLAGLMLQHLAERLEPLPELLIPVPLHPTRIRERGFNQSKELASQLGRALGMPTAYNAVQRSRATQAQTGLSAKQRQRNLKGAFQVCGQLAAKRVALVDDVMTTGSTVNELARCLKRAGVHEVEVWVAARAV